MPYARANTRRLAGRGQGGYVYLLMVVLLIVGSLYAILHRLDANSLKNDQSGTTAAALVQARDALLGYAVTYREAHPNEGNGYLPCPDMDGDGDAESSCNNAVNIGLLPYKTLGLPDLRDASGACLWYAVGAQFGNNPKTDPLNWDAQGGIAIADASGTHILQQNNDSRGGVAAVVFAPGAPLAGQSGRGNACGAVPGGTGAANLYLETTATPFRQGPGIDASGNTILNDQLLWLSSADIFDRIRQRSDFATYLNAGIKGIQSALSFSLATYPPSSTNTLPIDASGNPLPTSLSQSDQRFYLQWRDQFRYLKCSITGSYCYHLGAQNCDGVLLFGGENSNGQPRPITGRALSNYFEAPTLDLATGSALTLTPVSTLYASTSLTTRSQDLALCLSPQSQSVNTNTPTPTTTPATVTSLTVTDPTGNGTSKLESYVVTGNGPAAIQLGQTGGSASAYDCLWYPEPFQLGAGSTPIHLRAYFAFTIDTLGQGFTFAMADADSSANPSSSMCGNSGAALGYAGSNGVTASINYPKMALEIDTHQDASFGDADAHHFAFVHWGTDGSQNDDNTHGVGNNPSSTSIGYKPYIITAGKTYYIRLDMTRTYDSVTGSVTHESYAYITTSTCPQYADLSADLSSQFPPGTNLCTDYSAHDIFVLPKMSNGSVPMKQIWIGFTSGQDASGQSILIQPFQMQISQ